MRYLDFLKEVTPALAVIEGMCDIEVTRVDRINIANGKYTIHVDYVRNGESDNFIQNYPNSTDLMVVLLDFMKSLNYNSKKQ